MEQRSKEWFDARKGLITGSIAGAILGFDPFRKKDDAMRQMVRDYFGAESEFTGNVATEYGVRFEDTARASFEAETMLDVTEYGFIKNGIFGVSPDGLVGEDSGIEIKCPFSKRNDPMPEFKDCFEQQHYYAQVQLSLYVTGRRKWYFYQWSPQGTKLEVITPDTEWQSIMLWRLEEFYDEFQKIIHDVELHSKYLGQSVIEFNGANDLEIEYIQAKEQLAIAKERMDNAKAALIQFVGEDTEKAVIGSLKLSKVKKEGSISYSKVVKELLPEQDLEPYRGKESQYWVIK
jgi:putative phage-type endonuclease